MNFQAMPGTKETTTIKNGCDILPVNVLVFRVLTRIKNGDPCSVLPRTSV